MDKTDEEKKVKMNKLLDIWEKDNYFSPEIIEKLRNPSVGVKYYQESIYSENSQLISSIEAEIDAQLKLMENQHREYVNHCNAQIANLQNQIAQVKQKQQQHFMHIPPPTHLPPPNLINQLPQSSSNNNSNNSSPSKPQPLMSLMSLNLNPKESASKQHVNQSQVPSTSQPLLPKPPSQTSQQGSGKIPLMSIPPPNVHTNSPSHTGLLPTPNIEPIKPSPSIQQSKSNLEIEMAYYSLPAGLMAQLVKTEDEAYKPIDPKLVKLPAPQAPSEKLLKAMEEFYSVQSKPRNSDGWSKTGLYEFYKTKLKSLADRPTKNQSRIEKSSRGRRSSKSSTNSSRSRSRGRHRRRGSSSSSASSRSSSRRRSSSKSSSRSRSSRSSSRSPRRRRSKSSERTRPTPNRPRPISRSPTPPQHIGFAASAASMDTRIDTSNKGHQMLQRMGWSGQAGLGRTEQGMVNPINASGDVRDNTEMYRGIGIKSDPFEAFRKNKSKGYIQRIRSRDEQREIMRKSLDNRPS